MNTVENKQIMARNIKFYMAVKGVKNQQLCNDLDIRYTTFMEWIKGRSYPRIGALEKLANYFGCNKSDLVEDKSKLYGANGEVDDKRQALIQFAHTVPEDKVELVLRVMRSIAEED